MTLHTVTYELSRAVAQETAVCTIHISPQRDRLMRSREMIRMIEDDGWYLVEIKGSHRQYKHPIKAGRVTVPHPKDDLPKGTVHSILKQAGLR
jgi:predicted RNA binding protein YcfA (HicA-like mRNA interferase family)